MDKTLEQLKAEFEKTRQAMWDMEDAIGAMKEIANSLYVSAYDAYTKKLGEE